MFDLVFELGATNRVTLKVCNPLNMKSSVLPLFLSVFVNYWLDPAELEKGLFINFYLKFVHMLVC